MKISKTAQDSFLDAFGQFGVAIGSTAKAIGEAMANAIEKSEREQERALYDLVLASFKDWAEAQDFDAAGWSVNGDGDLVTPFGDTASLKEAARSLQRIATMKKMAPEELVATFFPQENINVLPLAVEKQGQPTLQVVAAFDGHHYAGPEGVAHPERASLLIAFEGEHVDDARWQEPAKLYRLLEYGYAISAPEEELPF